MSAASIQQRYEDEARARWRGGPNVVAFLFAHPDSDAMRMLDNRGEYFDIRTGDTWDLFFPGYYQSSDSSPAFESSTGARVCGRDYLSNWYFNPRDFDQLRRHVEHSSQERWRYSGGTDLVLVGAWLPETGDVEVDWSSTISGEITDRASGCRSLTLAGVIERMTHDLTSASHDPAYGIAEVVNPSTGPRHPITREFIVSTLSGMAAALGVHALGAN